MKCPLLLFGHLALECSRRTIVFVSRSQRGRYILKKGQLKTEQLCRQPEAHEFKQ
jgi:hypothetical protein